MGKIIIHIDGVEDKIALEKVLDVVKEGKISKMLSTPCYCFATVYQSGVTVLSQVNKTGTNIFRVSLSND